MNVCLVSAPTANDFDDPELAETDAVRTIAEHAPLGILSLAAVLQAQGLEPEIVDLNRLYYRCLRSDEYLHNEIDFSTYVARALSEQPFDFFGFSTICSSYPVTLRIAEKLKKIFPQATIALGGPQASVVDMATMERFGFIDLTIRGEAEQTLPAVLDCFETRKSIATIPGITYRSGNTLMRNTNAPLIMDLDKLPFPAFDRYEYMGSCSYIPLELGRGCPFACTFCSTNDFFRRRFRLKTPSHIVEEMRRVKEIYGIQAFDLVHDMFTVDRKRVVAFCNAVLESGEKFVWGCSARTDCIDDELIELMAEAGCRGIFFGIETGSTRMQKIINKDLDLTEAANRVAKCDRHEIQTAVSLITGFPEETDCDFRDTITFFMDSLRYDYAEPQLCILAPLADTPLYHQHEKELIFDDIISDMSFQGWRQDAADRQMIADHPKIFPNFYSIPTPHLERQLLKEMREFILNGMQSLRWLLVALHQDGGHLLDVFLRWRAWREKEKAPFPEGNATIYYAQADFHRDLIEFVRRDYIPNVSKAPLALATLSDYEASFLPELVNSKARRTEEFGDSGETISGGSVPRASAGIHFTELYADYHAIVGLLRERRSIADVPSGNVMLVTRTSCDKRTQIIQLSHLSAQVLSLCNGKDTVLEIAEKFTDRGFQVDGVPAETTCLFGIEVLRRQGIVELGRSTLSVTTEEPVMVTNRYHLHA